MSVFQTPIGRLFVVAAAGAMVTAAITYASPDEPVPPTAPPAATNTTQASP